MKIIPLRTPRITINMMTLTELLDGSLSLFGDKSVLVITSKIVSLCEGHVEPVAGTDKEALIKREADYYLDPSHHAHHYHATITGGTFVAMAGIDESNAGGMYVLWPKDPQRTANEARRYLRERFGVKHAGVIIVDSVSQLLRRGAGGIALAYSGFKPLRDYRQQPDLFGRPMKVTMANICGGLAAAAVVVMGEGAECQPLAVISDVPSLEFQDADPSTEELAEYFVPVEEDLFAPFLLSAPWQRR